MLYDWPVHRVGSNDGAMLKRTGAILSVNPTYTRVPGFILFTREKSSLLFTVFVGVQGPGRSIKPIDHSGHEFKTSSGLDFRG